MKVCPHCEQCMPEYGGIIHDTARGTVSLGGVTVTGISAQLSELFAYLLAGRGRVKSRYDCLFWLYQLKPECDWPEDKIIDVFMSKLRTQLRPLEVVGLRIETAWGRGYYLPAPAVKTAVAVNGDFGNAFDMNALGVHSGLIEDE